MRSFVLFLLLTFCLGSFVLAQDVITTRNGDKINAKVLRVGEREIEYKLYDNQDGPLHTMLKSDVETISYPNGSVDSFNAQPDSGHGTGLYEKGAADAKNYYKAQGPALGAGLSALYPFYGVISAVVISSTRPRYENLNFPDYNLMEQPEYRRGYEDKAFRIKKNKTWTGFGIGTGALATVVAAILIVSIHH